MTTTMLPPSDARDTEPPERARDSTLPPADLGPTGLALRLLTLEENVADIHAETIGTSKALDDIRLSVNAIAGACAAIERDLTILLNDARGQRADRARIRVDLDELEGRVTRIERNEQ